MCARSRAGAVISFRQTGKTYRALPLSGRAVRAVDDVTLDVGAGEVVGIAGPNGAGKSTLIALLLGFLRPTAGEVRIEGAEPRSWVKEHGIAYLPELIHLPPRWRLDSALTRLAILGGVPAPEVESRVESAIERLGLEEHRSKRIKALSKGTLQRAGIAQTLLAADARLCVLDEPTHGLDPVWTLRFRDIVAQERRPDRAMLIASHVLDELERICDRVAIIDHGRIQRVVETRGLAGRRLASAYRITVTSGAELVASVFPAAASTGPGEFVVEPADIESLNRGIASLIERGGRIAAVVPAQSALEREFREAVGGTS